MIMIYHETQNSTMIFLITGIRTNRPEQSVQTQIELFLNEQYDKGLQCLPCIAAC